jgi:endonuclease/exonuclease/phosphatase family metal-dependent hydrolase
MLPKTRMTDRFDLQRGYIEAVIAVPSGALRVYCTHLSHVSAAQRLPQIDSLMKAVSDAETVGATWDATAPETFVFQEPPLPVPAEAIVAGDMNFTPKHPEYPRVIQCGLADTWHAAGHGEEEVDSFPRAGRIDHVFVTPGLATKVTGARIGYGIAASDHWPVFVQFAL